MSILEPTDAEVRNAALCVIALEECLADAMTPERAIAYARGIEAALDEEPWADGKHCGDCTKDAHTCARCLVEQAERDARRWWEEP